MTDIKITIQAVERLRQARAFITPEDNWCVGHLGLHEKWCQRPAGLYAEANTVCAIGGVRKMGHPNDPISYSHWEHRHECDLIEERAMQLLANTIQGRSMDDGWDKEDIYSFNDNSETDAENGSGTHVGVLNAFDRAIDNGCKIIQEAAKKQEQE